MHVLSLISLKDHLMFAIFTTSIQVCEGIDNQTVANKSVSMDPRNLSCYTITVLTI